MVDDNNQQYNIQPPTQPVAQPVYQPGMQPPVQVEKKNSGLGIAALVLGIIAVTLMIIPILNNLSIILGILAIVFALCSFKSTGSRGNKRGRGMVIAGLVLGIVSVVVAFAVQAMLSSAIDKVNKEFDKTSKKIENVAKGIAHDKAKELKLTVKASAPTEISVSAGGATSNEKLTDNAWEKVLTGKEAQKDYMVTTMPTFDIDHPVPDDYQVECAINVDGKQVSHKNATGTGATVMCMASESMQE